MSGDGTRTSGALVSAAPSRRRDLEVLAPGLVALVAATSAESMTRAAFALKVSPSTLSRQIARLQAELGLTLFERAGRSMRLTADGERLVRSAQDALEGVSLALDELRTGAASPAGPPPRLGLVRTLGVDIVPRALAAFRAVHGQRPIELHQGSTARLLDRIAEGDLDLALLAPVPRDERYASVPVLRQPFELVVPAGHRLASAGSVSFADLGGTELVVLQPGYGTRTCVDEMSRRYGVRFDIVFETDDTDMARGLVAAGIGLAIVPRVGEHHQEDLVALPFREQDAFRTICITWSAERGLEPAAAALRDFFIGHLRGPDPVGGADRPQQAAVVP